MLFFRFCRVLTAKRNNVAGSKLCFANVKTVSVTFNAVDTDNSPVKP